MKDQKHSLKIRAFLSFNLDLISDFCVLISSCKRGFTLVELLVVIGIATLSLALLFPNFMAARMRARDSQRKREIGEIQKALELYKLDQNPPTYPTGTLSGLCGTSWTSAGGTIYMNRFPCDPIGVTPTPYVYALGSSDILTYTLTACLENAVDSDKDAVNLCTSPFTSYTIKEP